MLLWCFALTPVSIRQRKEVKDQTPEVKDRRSETRGLSEAVDRVVGADGRDLASFWWSTEEPPMTGGGALHLCGRAQHQPIFFTPLGAELLPQLDHTPQQSLEGRVHFLLRDSNFLYLSGM